MDFEFDLSTVPTCELVEELKKREGVDTVNVEPYENYIIQTGLTFEELVLKVGDYTVKNQKVSIVMLERELNLGYSITARCLTELENKGVIANFIDSQEPRKVLLSDEQWLKVKFNLFQPNKINDNELQELVSTTYNYNDKGPAIILTVID